MWDGIDSRGLWSLSGLLLALLLFRRLRRLLGALMRLVRRG